MEYKLCRKNKSFDIVSLMGGNRTTGVAEQNPKQNLPQVPRDLPRPKH